MLRKGGDVLGTMTASEMAKGFMEWEYEHGEDVLEYNFAPRFDEFDFMEWCLENGKIDKATHDSFLKVTKEPYACYEICNILFSDEESETYVVVSAKHLRDENGDIRDEDEFDALRLKAFEVFAEYVLTFEKGQEMWEEHERTGGW